LADEIALEIGLDSQPQMNERSFIRDSLHRRRRTIEDAALRLFARQGFHGVGLRDLAREAGVSLGNIYNHFPSKEPIFAALVDRLYADFTSSTEPLARFLQSTRFPDDLEELGRVMREMVERHRDYLTLVYVDIAELGGKHVRTHYAALASRFRAALGPAAGHALPSWADPGVVFALVYMQFSSFFVIERLIGAQGHLDLPEDEAVTAIARLFMLGLAPRPARRTRDPDPASKPAAADRGRKRRLRGRVGARHRE
jgi:AcrR family transcriptional regulator